MLIYLPQQDRAVGRYICIVVWKYFSPSLSEGHLIHLHFIVPYVSLYVCPFVTPTILLLQQLLYTHIYVRSRVSAKKINVWPRRRDERRLIRREKTRLTVYIHLFRPSPFKQASKQELERSFSGYIINGNRVIHLLQCCLEKWLKWLVHSQSQFGRDWEEEEEKKQGLFCFPVGYFLSKEKEERRLLSIRKLYCSCWDV